MNELEALIRLNHFSHLGSIKIRLLLNHFGSAIQVLETSFEEIIEFLRLNPKVLSLWNKELSEQKWKLDFDLIDRFQVQVIPFTHSLYPQRLLEIVDFPVILYMLGTPLKKDQNCLAVIGTRQATLYGQEMARELSKELAHSGYTIVSGLARGIDTLAHQAALEVGRTIAVLGSGLASIYPAENKLLSQQIEKNGVVMSEFPMATPPDRQNFPQRNRIVSGMSLGTVLVEAPSHSGAILTAERAIGQGRPVFAMPGRVDQECFRGNHDLIKRGKAHLIENAQDVLKHFNDFSLPLDYKQVRSVSLSDEEEAILKNFSKQERSVEELVMELQWPIAKINVLLMSLVLKKVIKEYPGKIYKKIN